MAEHRCCGELMKRFEFRKAGKLRIYYVCTVCGREEDEWHEN